MLVVIAFSLSCESNKNEEETEILVREFFKDYEKTSASIAVDNLFAQNSWSAKIDSSIVYLKNQLEYFKKDIGNYNGYELITKKKVGNSFMHCSYIVKHERMPLRFSFQFYKYNEAWIIYSFNFDSDIGEEVQTAASLYFLNLEEK
jgi:hypothetical protein